MKRRMFVAVNRAANAVIRRLGLRRFRGGDGVRTPVRGTEVTGPERDALWQRLNAEVFDYEPYQRQVDRGRPPRRTDLPSSPSWR